MATDLTQLAGFIELAIKLTSGKSADLATALAELSAGVKDALTFGTGDGQINQIWHDRRTLAASTPEDIDLAGALTNAHGGTVTFATVKFLFIHNRSDKQGTPTAAVLRIGGGTHEWQGFFAAAADKLTLRDGAWLVWASPNTGETVTVDTADDIGIEETAALQAEYDIVVAGVSA